jgi:hypothetical protein
MTETNCEQSSMFGNKTYKAGEAVFLKYWDNASQHWERASGSGAPNLSLKGVDVNGIQHDVPVINNGALRVSAESYLYAVAEGDIPNHFAFAKLGNVSSVVNTEQDIWTQGGKYVFPINSGSMKVQSTSPLDHSTGSGIRTLTVSLSGSTPVTTSVNDIYRINTIRVVTLGTLGKSAGVITISGSADSNIYRQIGLGQTRGRSLIYTVPSGSTLYIVGLNLSSVATATGHFSTFTMRANYDDSTNAKIDFMQPWFEMTLQDQAQHFEFNLPVKIPSTCDVVGSVIAETSNANTVCYGSWRGWIET